MRGFLSDLTYFAGVDFRAPLDLVFEMALDFKSGSYGRCIQKKLTQFSPNSKMKCTLEVKKIEPEGKIFNNFFV